MSKFRFVNHPNIRKGPKKHPEETPTRQRWSVGAADVAIVTMDVFGPEGIWVSPRLSRQPKTL